MKGRGDCKAKDSKSRDCKMAGDSVGRRIIREKKRGMETETERDIKRGREKKKK